MKILDIEMYGRGSLITYQPYYCEYLSDRSLYVLSFMFFGEETKLYFAQDGSQCNQYGDRDLRPRYFLIINGEIRD
jgi:hypothetical protein